MEATTSATQRHLPEDGARSRPSLVEDAREILTDYWRYRDLLMQLTLRDIKIRYKQSVMGFAWALLVPVLIILAGVIVRVAISYLSRTSLEASVVAGIAVKSVPWAFFVGAIGFANASLVGNLNLVTKVYFPREVLPMSATLAQTFDTLIAAGALALAFPFLGGSLGWGVLWVVPLGAILFALTAALALALSCANLFFRDVKYIVQVFITFGIFLTPVFFEAAMFPGRGGVLIMLNPLAPILEGLRLAVVEGHSLLTPLTTEAFGGMTLTVWEPWYILYSAAWGIGGLAVASLLFHRLEYVFAEYA